MDLNDFGTQCDGSPRQPPAENAFYHHERNFLPQESPTAPIQWKVSMPGVFEACGATHRQLPAGAYTCSLNQYGEPQLLAKDLQVDDLIDFADSLPSQILKEIENFWSLGDRFER